MDPSLQSFQNHSKVFLIKNPLHVSMSYFLSNRPHGAVQNCSSNFDSAFTPPAFSVLVFHFLAFARC